MSSATNQPKASRTRKIRRASMGLITAGLLLLLFQGSITDYTRAAFALDGIYIPQPNHHFTNPKAGEVLSHSFRVYNLRPRRLAVQVEPDCGCTGVSWTQATIAPFGWKEFTAKIEGGEKTASTKSVGIALRTDSQQRPLLFVFLKA